MSGNLVKKHGKNHDEIYSERTLKKCWYITRANVFLPGFN